MHPIKLAAVSYLNAAPLLYGLENDPTIALQTAVPSRLIDFLRDESADVALLPIIDFQRMPGLRILRSGGIGSDGPTLTVRLFAKQPIEKIKTLACDPDSHTSVALAKIILAEKFSVWPELVDLARTTEKVDEALLLIGDKVVCDEPKNYPHQYDLGGEWKSLTGLPFVFAAWTARPGVSLGDLSLRLERAKCEGLAHVDELIEEQALPRRWPAHLARQYMTSYLKYDIGEREIVAIKKFFAMAHAHGIIPSLRDLIVE